MKIGYFADGPWSHQALERILSDADLSIAFICARHDKPDLVLQQRAKEIKIPFLVHSNVNSNEFITALSNYNVDIFVSMSFNQIFRSQLLNYPSLGTINCHAGKLPFYRGRNILNWALINDEKEFGITVHYMDEGVDTGDIILQDMFPITDEDSYATLLQTAYMGCSELLYKAIKQLQVGTAMRMKQDSVHPVGFYCSARRPGDERLNWSQASRDIFNFVRALCPPGPSACTYLAGEEIKINRVEYIAEAPTYKGIPGAVLKVSKDGWLVKTEDSFVRVLDWDSKVVVRVGDRLI